MTRSVRRRGRGREESEVRVRSRARDDSRTRRRRRRGVGKVVPERAAGARSSVRLELGQSDVRGRGRGRSDGEHDHLRDDRSGKRHERCRSVVREGADRDRRSITERERAASHPVVSVGSVVENNLRAPKRLSLTVHVLASVGARTDRVERVRLVPSDSPPRRRRFPVRCPLCRSVSGVPSDVAVDGRVRREARVRRRGVDRAEGSDVRAVRDRDGALGTPVVRLERESRRSLVLPVSRHDDEGQSPNKKKDGRARLVGIPRQPVRFAATRANTGRVRLALRRIVRRVGKERVRLCRERRVARRHGRRVVRDAVADVSAETGAGCGGPDESLDDPGRRQVVGVIARVVLREVVERADLVRRSSRDDFRDRLLERREGKRRGPGSVANRGNRAKVTVQASESASLSRDSLETRSTHSCRNEV